MVSWRWLRSRWGWPAALERRPESPAALATIVRDSAGIPHITASNFRALGYGEAWAFSQDNFCALANDFVTVNGDRSKAYCRALSGGQ